MPAKKKIQKKPKQSSEMPQATVSCPICGSNEPVGAIVCSKCSYERLLVSDRKN